MPGGKPHATVWGSGGGARRLRCPAPCLRLAPHAVPCFFQLLCNDLLSPVLARHASHADGRPLTAVLDQQQQFTRRGASSHKPRPGQIREPKEGWSKPLPRAATAAAASTAAGPQSDAEAAELYALSRVGQRKQVRPQGATH